MDNALYVGLSRQMTLRRHLDIVANNIANADTAGFKTEQPLIRTEPKAPARSADGPNPIKFVLDSGLARDFSQGALRTTNAAFDLAIDGPGFFRIQTPGGQRFTRDGHFRLDETGRIVTQSGQPVLDPGGAEVIIDPRNGPVEIARDGAEALLNFESVKPDIILLDVMLPKVSGTDVCKEIRKKRQVPIIMVSAKGSEIDTIVGLEVGADDYIVKPYRLRELVARIRAALRRSSLTESEIDEVGIGTVRVGEVQIDPEQHMVTVRGTVTKLPLKEFELLYVLMANAGRVMTRENLIDRVWGSDYYGDTKTLDVHIKRLRSKIEIDPANPVNVVTIRGLGYKYEKLNA